MANPAAGIRAKVLAAHPKAVVEQRGPTYLRHRLADAPDGRPRYAGDYFIGPIHYGGPDWQEIDTAFQPSVAPWDWEMTKADFHIHALSRLDAGQVVEYRDGDEWVRFQPMALQYSNDLDQIQPIAMPENVQADVDDDTMTWTDGYGSGRSLSWQAEMAGLAKLLTITAPTDLPPVEQFILDGGNPCLEFNLIFAYSSGVTPYINGHPWTEPMKDVETQGLVEFRDGDGNILWWFNLPRSWDAEGNEQLGTLRFKKQGNSLYVSHRVPLSFVQGAIYPLRVDVIIDKQVAAGADDGRLHGDSFYAAGTNGYLGNYNSEGCHNFNRWTGVTLEGTINVSYIEVYGWPTGTALTKIYGVDEDNPAAPTSAAEFNADPLTTAGVDWDGEWAGGWNESPSLNTIFQELVDTYTISDEAVMVQIKDDGSPTDNNLEASFYEYPGNIYGAKLHIEYTAAGVTTRRYGLPVLGVG